MQINAQMMINEGHYASEEIQMRAGLVEQLEEAIQLAWQEKRVHLDAVVQQQQFMKDAHSIEAISIAQGAYLINGTIPTNIEQVESALKRHETFEKVLQTQEEKLHVLECSVQDMCSQSHFDAVHMIEVVEEAVGRRDNVRQLADERKRKLLEAHKYATFKQDITETFIWINDKRRFVEAAVQQDMGQNVSLKEKMQKLQKHQTVEAELASAEPRILLLKQNGEELLAIAHTQSAEIEHDLKELITQWQALKNAAEGHTQLLEEARDILNFHSEVSQAAGWIHDKALQVRAGETGRDYEHCVELLQKLEDRDSPRKVTKDTIREINELADKLEQQNQSDSIDLNSKLQQLNTDWTDLQLASVDYRERLDGALEVHEYIRDCDEMTEIINDKAVTLQLEDCGKELHTVETLQRKQEMTDQGIDALHGQIKDLEKRASGLRKRHPESSEAISDKETQVIAKWDSLCELSMYRRQQLDESRKLHKFFYDFRDLEEWANDLHSRMVASDLVDGVAESADQLQLHQELKIELEGRGLEFLGVHRQGEDILKQHDLVAGSDVRNSLEKLEEIQAGLSEEWHETQALLCQCHSFQVFKEHVDEAEAWLATKEAYLNNENLGESVADVRALMKKHDDFNRSLQAQEGVIDQLCEEAQQLIKDGHYNAVAIQYKCEKVTERRKHLWNASANRKRKLEKAIQLQQYLDNAHEVSRWIQEKMQIACDESYRDPTNLQSKIQKHQAFEAELLSNRNCILSVKQVQL
ncbi:PREDICTED: spectrin alpha chain, non-erythrocytic 1-like [Priapulus caudatus]|uniref:Spectrin alpha chain, non-erythrocytic 1-like n=1 Tax=Priapulus caudatus TaxID=37621 RepID=A0ABM1EFP8_PRICU|nr:PREDICTED: spectrin alpha chain, non-erythrocytic 1-like [Priapulus caudatus]